MLNDADETRRPDYGYGALGQAAGDLLAETDLSDKLPVIGLLYNVAARPPGPPSYDLAPTDPEMWECAPTPHDALDLLANITRFGAVTEQPGSAPAPLSHVRVDPRADRRLDGIVLAYRAWAGDSRTAAGRAVIANMAEGRYRHGDIAAMPGRRDIYMATVVDRDGNRIALGRLPGHPVQNLAEIFAPGQKITGRLGSGPVTKGLSDLLAALISRPDLRC